MKKRINQSIDRKNKNIAIMMVMITTAIAIIAISAIRTAQHLPPFYHCSMTSNICDSYLSIVNRTS